MLHEQNFFLTILTPLLPQHSLRSFILLSRGIPVPLDYIIILRGLALSATSCVPLDLYSFSIRSPFTASERRITVAFSPTGGRVSGGTIFIYHYGFFFMVESIQHGATGITASGFLSIYQFESVEESLLTGAGSALDICLLAWCVLESRLLLLLYLAYLHLSI